MKFFKKKSRWHGIRLRDTFELESKIASGGFATIFRAKDLTSKKTVAIKLGLAQDHSDHSDIIRKESNILKRLDHPNIVAILPIPRPDRAAIYNARAQRIVGEPAFFAMEYLAGGSLEDYLSPNGVLPLAETAAIALPIVQAVEHLHTTDYAHNDLKLKNIVFRQPVLAKRSFTPVLIDFGIVSKILPPPGQTMYITPPERINHADSLSKIDRMDNHKKVDVWGMGILLYRLSGGQLPFKSYSKKKLTDSICYERPQSLQTLSSSISNEWDEFVIDGCLAKRPADRLSISELINRLRPYAKDVVASKSGDPKKGQRFGKS